MEAKVAAMLSVVRGAAELMEANKEVLADLKLDDRRKWKSLVESMLGLIEQSSSGAVGAVNIAAPHAALGKRPRTDEQHRVACRPPAVSTILRSGDLLLHIMRFLVGKEERRDISFTTAVLCRLSLVCRAWRAAAQHESLWEPLAKALIPRLCDAGRMDATRAELAEASGSYRCYILQEARLLCQNPVITLADWETYLVLQFEIWRERPRSHLFSGEGRMCREWREDTLVLSLDGLGVAPSFSTASIGGDDNESELGDKVSVLSIRVTVRDCRNGRKAALWNDTATEMLAIDGGGGADGYELHSHEHQLTTVAFGPASLSPHVCFRLEPEAGQDDALPENQKRFVVAEPSLLFFHCSYSEVEQIMRELEVARFVWSALQ